ncbi:Ras-related protein Rab-24, partial [Ophiophagus hannah]
MSWETARPRRPRRRVVLFFASSPVRMAGWFQRHEAGGRRMSGQRVDAKVVMLGKEYVGKTSLVERYVHNRFLVGPYQNTIGAAFVAKVMPVGGRTVTLGIWDTAGSERYEAMSRIYYRGAKAAIVCYDLTDRSSFQRAKFWVNELQNFEEVEIKAELFETSSKTGQNVDELFQKVAEDYVHFTAFELTEEKGVDLNQKSTTTYFYSCCHH